VHVVEGKHQRLRHGEPLDQLAHRVMGLEPLGRGARLVRGRAQRAKRGEHGGELAELVRGEALVLVRIECLEVGIEGVDDQTERQLAFHLRCPAAEHQAPAPLGAARELSKQRGLADPRLAGHDDEAGGRLARLIQQAI
jgi:hypothetical protein